MAVTKSAPQSNPRLANLLWVRLHFVIRALGLIGAMVAGVGLIWLAPSDLSTLLEPNSVGATILYAGLGAAVLALVVEILAAFVATAGRRSALGLHALFQCLLAAALVVGVNYWSFGHHIRLDCTHDQVFTLPEDLRSQLQLLRDDKDQRATVVIYQRHKTFGGLSDKPDRYDYAAERKLVDKVRDLADLLRELGPQLDVVVLDVEEQGFDDRLERLTRDRSELKQAIELASENSIFIVSGEKSSERVQQMSFNELFQLDKVASASDRNNQGNLVLLGQGKDGQGMYPFVRRILNLEQRRPRVGVLAIHELLTTEGSEDVFTMRGLRKSLESHGFDVRDVVLKKGWETGPALQPAADTFEESKLDRLESERREAEEDIRDFNDALKAHDRVLTEMPDADSVTDEKLKRLREPLLVCGVLGAGGNLDRRDRESLLAHVKRGRERLAEELASRKKDLDRIAAEEKKLDLERISEGRRLSDVKAKLTYAVADCDLLLIPRLTRRSTGSLISPRLYKFSKEQTEGIKAFLASGRPIFVCAGPTNLPAGARDDDEDKKGPSDPDLENILSELGFRLGKQTVLFQSDAKAFAERRSDSLRGAGGGEAPLLDFNEPTWAADPRYKAGAAPVDDNPLRQSLRVTARSVGQGFELRLRFPRPVYYEPPGATSPATAGSVFLLTATGWNDDQPFPTPNRRPRFTPPKSDDPANGSLDERRRGPFSVGAAAEVTVPKGWRKDKDKDQKVRVAVIGQGEVFVGPTLSPSRERLLLQTANWLVGRDDYLPRDEHPWSYPRLDLQEDDVDYRRWLWGARWGLPALFAVLGFGVLMYRRLR